MNTQTAAFDTATGQALSELTVRLITEQQSFLAVESQWSRLWTAATKSTPFNSFHWHYVWWLTFGDSSNNTLQIWTVWDGDLLVGVMPMYIHSAPLRGQATLLFLGTGESHRHEVATEYSDVLVSPYHEHIVLPMLATWLNNCSVWSRVELRCLLQSSLIINALNTHATDAHRLDLDTGFRFRVPLDNNQSALQLMGGEKTKRIKRSLRVLDRDGGMRRVSASGSISIDEAFDNLIQLSGERQSTKQRKSAFQSSRFLQFHKQLCLRMVPLGMADIHCYYLGETLLASVYCFYDKNTTYYYQSGFSGSAGNKYMPLTVAHLQEATSARNARRHFYDLMRAEVPSYKEAMASDKEPLYNVHLFCKRNNLKRYQLLRTIRRSLVKQLGNIGIERR